MLTIGLATDGDGRGPGGGTECRGWARRSGAGCWPAAGGDAIAGGGGGTAPALDLLTVPRSDRSGCCAGDGEDRGESGGSGLAGWPCVRAALGAGAEARPSARPAARIIAPARAAAMTGT